MHSVDRHRAPGVIDEELLTGDVPLAHRALQAPLPAPVALAEGTAPAGRFPVPLDILFPQQLQRHMPMALPCAPMRSPGGTSFGGLPGGRGPNTRCSSLLAGSVSVSAGLIPAARTARKDTSRSHRPRARALGRSPARSGCSSAGRSAASTSTWRPLVRHRPRSPGGKTPKATRSTRRLPPPRWRAAIHDREHRATRGAKVFTIPWNAVHVAVESVFTIPWKSRSRSRGIRSLRPRPV